MKTYTVQELVLHLQNYHDREKVFVDGLPIVGIRDNRNGSIDICLAQNIEEKNEQISKETQS